MKAVRVRDEQLVLCDEPSPELQRQQVRIRVHSTAVNRADLAQRAGTYPPPPGVTDILGLECSGTVVEVGSEVAWPQKGEQVCALLSGGGYATEVVCPAKHVLPLPPGLSLSEAAAVPEVFTTAWLNLRREGDLKKGERVLIHAAASGVGTAALQLCRAWGNPAFATVGSAEKEARCRELGAEESADRHHGPWREKVKAWGGADLILDPVGGDYLSQNIRVLKKRGRLVNIGLLGGAEGSLPLGHLLVKRLRVLGSVLRSRSDEEKADILQAMREELWPLFASGQLQAIVECEFPLAKAEAAHQLLASNQTVGKILLRVED